METSEKILKLKDLLLNCFANPHLSNDLSSGVKRVMDNFYNTASEAKYDFEKYCDLQYIVDYTLQLIARALHGSFDEQKRSKEFLSTALGTKACYGGMTRESLVTEVVKKNNVSAKIETLKSLFNELLSAAKDLGLQVFDEEEFRYSWYYSLHISKIEIYRYFQREGVPEAFLKS